MAGINGSFGRRILRGGSVLGIVLLVGAVVGSWPFFSSHADSLGFSLHDGTLNFPPVPWEHVGYGINVKCAGLNQGYIGLVGQLGFEWVKTYDLYRERLPYKVLYRIPFPAYDQTLDEWAQALEALVAEHAPYIEAYEVGNEPNIKSEWCKSWPDWLYDSCPDPNPADYVELLKIAYPIIKRYDPDAIVVSAAMSPTGPADPYTPHPVHPEVWNDVQFIREMYEHGAKGYFDALGSHPFGFLYAPEVSPWECFNNHPRYGTRCVTGLCFRRAEQQREVMVQFGDADKQLWATEMGWIIEPPSECHLTYDWQYRLWHVVTEGEQADYLVRSFEYAIHNWPWMGVIFVWNLDYASCVETSGYPYGCEPARWCSIIHADKSHRPAFDRLRDMPKLPYMTLDTNQVSLMVDSTSLDVYTRTLVLDNLRRSDPLHWTVSPSPSWLGIKPVQGVTTQPVSITLTISATAKYLMSGTAYIPSIYTVSYTHLTLPTKA